MDYKYIISYYITIDPIASLVMSTPDFAKPWFMKILGVPSK